MQIIYYLHINLIIDKGKYMLIIAKPGNNYVSLLHHIALFLVLNNFKSSGSFAYRCTSFLRNFLLAEANTLILILVENRLILPPFCCATKKQTKLLKQS